MAYLYQQKRTQQWKREGKKKKKIPKGLLTWLLQLVICIDHDYFRFEVFLTKPCTELNLEKLDPVSELEKYLKKNYCLKVLFFNFIKIKSHIAILVEMMAGI